MDEDRRWRDWLAALAEQGRDLDIANCQIYRTASWKLGRRCLPYHILHVIEEGGQEGLVDGQRIETSPGDALWIPAGTVHDMLHRSGCRRLTFANLRFALPGIDPPPLPVVLRQAAGARERLADLRREWLSDLPDRAARLRAMLVLLFSELRRALAARSSGLAPAQQERLLRLIETDPALRTTPRQLAVALGLSPTWFARLFRRTYGCAPRTWLMRQRIQHAAAQLGQGDSIGAVAARFGYADLFLFSRQFRAVMGMNARTWLSRHGA